MNANRIDRKRVRTLLATGVIAVAVVTAGCNLEMRDDSRLKPLEGSPVFADGRSARPLVTGTVARHANSELGAAFLTGMNDDGQPTADFPLPVNDELLERGRKKFEIYCSMCHGHAGYADGTVVKRGFPPPPSYHIDRLRRAPVGHIYDVITNGYGVMYSYADRIQTPEDRWAVVAYVRALQLSQYAPESDVPADALKAAGVAKTGPAEAAAPAGAPDAKPAAPASEKKVEQR